jgi:hypothetical protein
MELSRLLVGVMVLDGVAGCTGNDTAASTATEAASPESPATSSTPVTATAPTTSVQPAVTATVAPAQTPPVGDPIPVLFREPRFEEPDTSVELGPRPASVFPEQGRRSVMLCDTETGTVMELGQGTMVVFSTDNRYMAWAEFAEDRNDPSKLHAIDLESDAVSELGEIRGTWCFGDERHVRVWLPGGNRNELVDVETGDRKPVNAIALKGVPQPSESFTISASEIYGSAESVYHVTAKAGELRVLTVVALDAKFATDAGLLVLIDAGEGGANIFVIDLNDLEATFVATTLMEPFRFSTIPLVANEDYVVWTPNFCDLDYYERFGPEERGKFERREGSEPARGRTMVFDRATGRVTKLTDSELWVAGFTPGWRIIEGSFGVRALIDPATLTWDVVLPDDSTDARWSPDYRYASRGEQYGHGGVCPV